MFFSSLSTSLRHTMQPICLSDFSVTAHSALFYRGRGQLQVAEDSQSIRMEPYASLAFNTYFNSLSYAKWRMYTHVRQAFLSLRLQGKFTVVLYGQNYNQEDVQAKSYTVDTSTSDAGGAVQAGGAPFFSVTGLSDSGKECEAGKANSDSVTNNIPPPALYTLQECTFSFAGMESNHHLWFEITAHSSGAVMHGGEYFTVLDEAAPSPSPIRLAVMGVAPQQKLAEPPQWVAPLEALNATTAPHSITTCIVSLADPKGKANRPAGQWIACSIPSMGGAVARGVLENAGKKGKEAVTHILVLQASSQVSTHSIYSLLCFLALRRAAFANDAVSLAVLNGFQRTRQLYVAGQWQGKTCAPVKPMYDLTVFPQVMKNELLEKSNIALWGGVCHAAHMLTPQTLPPPFYSQASEAFFCLSNNIGIITLNGICLWQTESIALQNRFAAYYARRDATLMAAMRGTPPALGSFKKVIQQELTQLIYSLRYAEASVLLDSIEDFCQGPEWFLAHSPQQVHEKLVKLLPQSRPVNRQPYPFSYAAYERDRLEPKTTLWGHVIRKITLQGLLLPKYRVRVLPMQEKRTALFYRAKSVFLYDPHSQSGYLLRWNKSTVLELIKRWFRLRKTLDSSYARACTEFKERQAECNSVVLWNKVLGLVEE